MVIISEIKMPTSSQAMILFTADSAKVSKLKSRVFVPCPVSNVDISELLKDAHEDTENVIKEVQNHNTKQVKEVKINGYRTLLSYDPITNVFSWRVLVDKNKSIDSGHGPARPHSANCTTSKSVNFDRQSFTDTEGEIKLSDVKEQKGGTDEDESQTESLPNHLVKLGFRLPGTGSYINDIKKRNLSLSARKSTCYRASSIASTDHKQRKAKSAGVLNISTSKPNTHVRPSQSAKVKRSSQNLMSMPAESFHRRSRIKSSRPSSSRVSRFEALCGWDSTDIHSKYEDRCLPSVYMRKDVPDSDPLKCCFSLRDNEKLNHKELKDFVKEQVGVDITGLQYDPVSIRSGDPNVRNRWLATVSNFRDFDGILQKGLYINDEHIIFKSYDDVMEKEYNKYCYLKQICDETKRLANCKSAKMKCSK